MNIQYVSDLHIDYVKNKNSSPIDVSFDIIGDVLVVVGDVTDGYWKLTAEYLGKLSSDGVPILFVLGNHEYLNSIFPEEATDILRRATKDFPNVHILDKSSVVLQGVRFLGATLWSNFSTARYGYAAENNMPEYSGMYVASGDMASWRDVQTEHKKTLAWLRSELHKPFAGKTVVVTHHAPSYRSIVKKFQGSLLNGAYASNLDDFICSTKPAAWIHGHTHSSLDYTLGDTRIVCNPRGYEDELNPSFRPDKLLDIAP